MRTDGHAYARFGAMVATWTVAMFVLMYLNTFQLDHAFFSETRVYMAPVMGAAMAIIMLLFMRHMYSPSRTSRPVLIQSTTIEDFR